MHKAATRHHKTKANGTLHHDFAKIKRAMADTGTDVKLRAAQILANSYEDMQNASENVKTSVANYVYEKPFKSLSIAVISGFVLGFILRK